jgi:hypothetical protein
MRLTKLGGSLCSLVVTMSIGGLFALTACQSQGAPDSVDAELSSRLQVSDSEVGTTTASAAGTFSCDSGASFHMKIVAPDGAYVTVQIYVGDAANCETMAASLNQSRRYINHTVHIAICDYSADLYRFAVTADGEVIPLPLIEVGNSITCMSYANDINR